LNQEDSKFVELVLQGEKKALFFTSNTIIYVVKFLNFFPHITLMVQSKILWLNLKK
jgi:hypothetical protein